MTLRFLRLLFVVIAFMVIDGRSSEISSSTGSNFQLKSAASLNIDPISNPSVRENTKSLNYIADPFFPIVILADSLYEERDFSFYLPRYELQRQNHFFLLI